jgi:HSP20 family protein
MKSDSKKVVLKFELPEFNKKDINLRISKNFIQVKAEKKSENKTQKKGFAYEEKVQRSFDYSTSIPTIIPAKTKIEFKKGVLKITAPRKNGSSV